MDIREGAQEHVVLYSQQSNVALFMFTMAVAQLKLAARHPGYDPTLMNPKDAYHARSGRKKSHNSRTLTNETRVC